MFTIVLLSIVGLYLILKFKSVIQLLILQLLRIVVSLLLVGFSTGIIYILAVCYIKLNGK